MQVNITTECCFMHIKWTTSQRQYSVLGCTETSSFNCYLWGCAATSFLKGIPKGAPLRVWMPLNPVILLHSILLRAVRKLVNEDTSAEHCGRGADLLVTINVCSGDCRSPRHPFSPPARELADTRPSEIVWASFQLSGRCLWPPADGRWAQVASVTSDWIAFPQVRPFIVLLWALPVPRAVGPRRSVRMSGPALVSLGWDSSSPLQDRGLLQGRPSTGPALYPQSLGQFLLHIRAQKMCAKKEREEGRNKWKDAYFGEIIMSNFIALKLGDPNKLGF